MGYTWRWGAGKVERGKPKEGKLGERERGEQREWGSRCSEGKQVARGSIEGKAREAGSKGRWGRDSKGNQGARGSRG